MKYVLSGNRKRMVRTKYHTVTKPLPVNPAELEQERIKARRTCLKLLVGKGYDIPKLKKLFKVSETTLKNDLKIINQM